MGDVSLKRLLFHRRIREGKDCMFSEGGCNRGTAAHPNPCRKRRGVMLGLWQTLNKGAVALHAMLQMDETF